MTNPLQKFIEEKAAYYEAECYVENVGAGAEAFAAGANSLAPLVEKLVGALRMYSSDKIRLGSTISPRHANAALAEFEKLVGRGT